MKNDSNLILNAWRTPVCPLDHRILPQSNLFHPILQWIGSLVAPDGRAEESCAMPSRSRSLNLGRVEHHPEKQSPGVWIHGWLKRLLHGWFIGSSWSKMKWKNMNKFRNLTFLKKKIIRIIFNIIIFIYWCLNPRSSSGSWSKMKGTSLTHWKVIPQSPRERWKQIWDPPKQKTFSPQKKWWRTLKNPPYVSYICIVPIFIYIIYSIYICIYRCIYNVYYIIVSTIIFKAKKKQIRRDL